MLGVPFREAVRAASQDICPRVLIFGIPEYGQVEATSLVGVNDVAGVINVPDIEVGGPKGL